MMTIDTSTVYLVDDDNAVLKALTRLLNASGLNVLAFSSPQEFLERHDPSLPGCAVFDVSMPGLDGLQLQAALTAGEFSRPVIFITGVGDVPTSVRAMKAGAVDFLTKPVDQDDLLAAIRRAVQSDQEARKTNEDLGAIRSRLATLTPREREVMSHVVAGRLNKQIAFDLGTVVKTIKVHRGRVMHKMGVRTVTELVRVAERAGIEVPALPAINPDMGPKANSTMTQGRAKIARC